MTVKPKCNISCFITPSLKPSKAPKTSTETLVITDGSTRPNVTVESVTVAKFSMRSRYQSYG